MGTAAAFHRAAQIVHHHLGAARSEQQGVAAAQAVAGTGYYRNAVVVSNRHVVFLRSGFKVG
jgi:hypothetical protein